jgi:glutamate synthase (NADPH/NADH) large chain
MVAEEMRGIMARLGFCTINEMVGRVDMLTSRKDIGHWKSSKLDLSPLLASAQSRYQNLPNHCVDSQDHELDKAIDHQLISLAENSIQNAEPCKHEFPICNVNRAVGTMLSHRIVKRWGEQGLPEDSIHFKFRGSAGQSFGAFLCGGVTLELEGDANDYTGKGLSNGKLIVYPPQESTFRAEDNVIIGNVALYGATGGLAFIRGRAAERFGVRNSGARAVVEGVGDHACEYMTGGRVVVLGPTGRNFAAGMSGGIAYVWDPHQGFRDLCNTATVELEPLRSQEEIFEVYSLIDQHHRLTDSVVAERVLRHWNYVTDSFVKVMPLDYKRVLMERRKFDEEVDTKIYGTTTDG